MEYLTACCRQQTAGNGFLMLQQYRCRREACCFICIGGDRRSGIREKILDWVGKADWQEGVRRPAVWLSGAEGELEKLLDGYRDVKLLLGVGAELLIMGAGHRACLLNMNFGRGKLSELPVRLRATLEPGAGILLATDSFLERNGTRLSGEALKTGELRTEEQMRRRLEELAKHGEGADGGAERMAAILLGR